MKATRERVPIAGSDQARRNAAIILECLAGVTGSQDAAQAMGVALARYYQLEARALGSFVAALEPRSRGRQESDASLLKKALAERRRLERELHRYQALYRTAQKALGIGPRPSEATEVKSGKRKRRLRKVTRGEHHAAGLRALSAASTGTAAAEGSG
jgi:hypothetical protein